MANPQYITEPKVKTDKKTGEKIATEIKYRIDADFVPSASSEICMDFIENYCVAKNRTDWLVEVVQKTKPVKDKDGNNTDKTRDYTFIEIRAEFVDEFFPQIKGKKKKNKPTLKEKILAKYAK